MRRVCLWGLGAWMALAVGCSTPETTGEGEDRGHAIAKDDQRATAADRDNGEAKKRVGNSREGSAEMQRQTKQNPDGRRKD